LKFHEDKKPRLQNSSNRDPRPFKYRGSVLKFSNCAVTDGEKLLPIFKNAAPIDYFDFKEGDNQGYLRVSNRRLAMNLISVFHQNILVGGGKLNIVILEGEEEEEYIKLIKLKSNQKFPQTEPNTTQTPQQLPQTLPDQPKDPKPEVLNSEPPVLKTPTSQPSQNLPKKASIDKSTLIQPKHVFFDSDEESESKPKQDSNTLHSREIDQKPRHIIFDNSDDELELTNTTKSAILTNTEKPKEEKFQISLDSNQSNEILPGAPKSLKPLLNNFSDEDELQQLQSIIQRADEGFIHPSEAKHILFESSDEE
jgi:hypothetical protein